MATQARVDLTMRMKQGQSGAADEDIHSTDIQRLDRGVLYSWTGATHQYRESKLGSQSAPTDSSRQLAALASDLKCKWGDGGTRHDDSRRGNHRRGAHGSCENRCFATLRTPPRRPVLPARLGSRTINGASSRTICMSSSRAIDVSSPPRRAPGRDLPRSFTFFIQFGVPVDLQLLESIGTAIEPEGQALKTNAVLRASRSCFVLTQGTSSADIPPAMPAGQSDPAFMSKYVGCGMLLYTWVAELVRHPQKEVPMRPRRSARSRTELKAIRAQDSRESIRSACGIPQRPSDTTVTLAKNSRQQKPPAVSYRRFSSRRCRRNPPISDVWPPVR